MQHQILTILQGDALEKLRELTAESVQCCVTSPPYWGLRDYSTEGQLGLEKTPGEYVAKMVEVFREVRRVLRKDGTLWLNLGDSYASDFKGSGGPSEKQLSNTGSRFNGSRLEHGLKPKDLCGIPWRVAFALQADGWWLRSDIIWAKPNPMPESVTDRPTKSHEYLFLLTKSASYFYDAEAIREQVKPWNEGWMSAPKCGENRINGTQDQNVKQYDRICGANKRSVWTVATAPYAEAHFATYPPDLIKPCILAGTSAKGCCGKCGAPWERIVERESFCDVPRGSNPSSFRSFNDPQQAGVSCSTKTLGWQPTCKCYGDEPIHQTFVNELRLTPCAVLDPFAGSGTTGMVALELGRKAVLIELNPDYCKLIEQRCDVTPGLALC